MGIWNDSNKSQINKKSKYLVAIYYIVTLNNIRTYTTPTETLTDYQRTGIKAISPPIFLHIW